jgi:hypothetical protein
MEIRQSEEEPTRIYPALPNSIGVLPPLGNQPPVTYYQPNTDLICPTNQGHPAYNTVVVKRSTGCSTCCIATSVAAVVIAVLLIIAVFVGVYFAVWVRLNSIKPRCDEGYSILDCSLGKPFYFNKTRFYSNKTLFTVPGFILKYRYSSLCLT